MYVFDDVHLRELIAISNNMNHDTIGNAMTRAIALRSLILDPTLKAKSDEIMDKIRGFTRKADVGGLENL